MFSDFIKNRAKIFDKKIEYYEDKVNYDKICNKLDIPYPKRYFVLNNVDNIRNKKLPDNCVIKYNNLQGSSGIIFRKNGIFTNNLDLNQVIDFLKKNNKQSAGCQVSIKKIEQKLIIEELLFPSNNILYDIKCFAFNGIVNHIAIINPNNRGETYTIDKNYNRLLFDIRDEKNINKKLPQLKYLNEIINYGNKIAKELFSDTFVRIDFYSTTKGSMFGEFTFNPSGGNGFTKNADKILGKLL